MDVKKIHLGLILFFVACKGQALSSSNEIKVGVMDGPEASVMEAVIPLAKQKHNLDVKLIRFADYVAPNVALADGSIDVNAFQHKPYLDESVKANGFDFAIVGNTFLYPIAFYSKKYKSVKDLPKGAKIAIPNDPSNEGRTLLILQKEGLLRLKPDVGILATTDDIVENPKNFKVVTLDAAQLPRSLEDVDLAAINNNYAVAAGLHSKKDAILIESVDSPYMNIFVSRSANQNDSKIKQLIETYQSPEIIAKAEEIFKGAAVPGFSPKTVTTQPKAP